MVAHMSSSNLFYEQSSLGMMQADLDLKITNINQAFIDITGYSANEVINKRPDILSSGKQDKSFYKHMWEAINSDGYWSGEIWNKRKNGSIYPELLTINAITNAQKEKSGYIAIFSDISMIKDQGVSLGYLAHHDPLTGLPNRFFLNTHLDNAIERSIRNKSKLALLFIDLDLFKPINDTLGHSVGDIVLQKVAKRIVANLRDSDIVTRWGGDEFVIVLEGSQSADHSSIVASNLIDALKKPFFVQGNEIYISSSIGISTLTDINSHTPSCDLVRHADTAMYQAKKLGGNQFYYYDKEITLAIQQQAYIETELRTALEKGQFELYYQAKFNTHSNKIDSVEALIRWHHPVKGLIPPDKFISIAEKTGIITPISDWVLNTACKQAVQWLQEGTPVQIAINISAIQLNAGTLRNDIADSLNRTGLPPHLLEIELTESLLIHNVDKTVRLLKEINKLGVSIAIDDFGTGFSSLSYLTHFPVNKLKIDRCFIKKLHCSDADKRLIKAIVALAHSIDLTVVAEGIETLQQLNYLKEINCDSVQGFLLAKPVPNTEVSLN